MSYMSPSTTAPPRTPTELPSTPQYVGDDEQAPTDPQLAWETGSQYEKAVSGSVAALRQSTSGAGPSPVSLRHRLALGSDPSSTGAQPEPLHREPLSGSQSRTSGTGWEGTSIQGGSNEPSNNPDTSTTDGSARSSVQSLAVAAFISFPLLSIPRLSAFKQHDKVFVGSDRGRSPGDTEKLGGDARRAVRLFLLRRYLSLLLKLHVCILAPVVMYCATSAAHYNDTVVTNISAVTSSTLVMAHMNVRVTLHSVGGSDDLDEEPKFCESTPHGSRHTLVSPSVLISAPFAWTAWAFVLTLGLFITTLLRHPALLCRGNSKSIQTFFTLCGPTTPGAYVYLWSSSVIIMVVVIVIGTTHAIFNCYNILLQYPW